MKKNTVGKNPVYAVVSILIFSGFIADFGDLNTFKKKLGNQGKRLFLKQNRCPKLISCVNCKVIFGNSSGDKMKKTKKNLSILKEEQDYNYKDVEARAAIARA